MVKRARVIYNPSSGKELVKRKLPEILNVYEEAGYETSAFQTTPEALSAQKEAARCCEVGYDLVVAAGGDGTIHEVINGVAEKEYKPTLAIIPAGTTNDYARVLQIPRDDLVAAAKLIERKESIFMDIGKVVTKTDKKYFMNIGALGNFVEITFDISPQLKTVFGYLAYIIKGAELLPKVRPVPVKVKYEGGSYEGNATLIFVALSNSVGGFEKIVPNKVLGDGKFSLIIVKSGNVLELMQLVTRLLTDGTHLSSPNVISVETDFVNIDIEDESHLMINLDGEYGGDAPVHFQNLKQHVEVIANTRPMKVKINELSIEERARMRSIFTEDISNLENLFDKRLEENIEESQKNR